MHSWTSWPWLSWAGLLGAFLLLGLIAWRSDPAEGLFLILLPVLMALGAMLIGTAYHVMRTVLPPTKANRLLAAGISGAVPGLALALILIPSGFDRQVVFGLVILAGFGAFIALFREWMELRFAKDQR